MKGFLLLKKKQPINDYSLFMYLIKEDILSDNTTSSTHKPDKSILV